MPTLLRLATQIATTQPHNAYKVLAEWLTALKENPIEEVEKRARVECFVMGIFVRGYFAGGVMIHIHRRVHINMKELQRGSVVRIELSFVFLKSGKGVLEGV